jgi:hypothetical protein
MPEEISIRPSPSVVTAGYQRAWLIEVLKDQTWDVWLKRFTCEWPQKSGCGLSGSVPPKLTSFPSGCNACPLQKMFVPLATGTSVTWELAGFHSQDSD